MSRYDAEAVLSKLGFDIAQAADRVSEGVGWKESLVSYTRTGSDVLKDVVALSYTPQFEDADVAPLVKAISRQWIIPKGQNFTQAALRDALIKKYGPTNGPTVATFEKWLISTDGVNIQNRNQERELCNQKVAPLVGARSLLPGVNATIDPDCGSPIGSTYQFKKGEKNRVYALSMSMYDAYLVWVSHWQAFAANENARLDPILNQSSAGPEL